jgi:hypothetical protein
MANLPGKAWLDEDGRHVWWEHLCSAAKGTVRYMLPWPHWQAINGAMSPSVVCEVPGCGHHSIPLIQEPPADWEPRKERPGMPANVSIERPSPLLAKVRSNERLCLS